MIKIALAGEFNFTDEQRKRLESIGTLKSITDISSSEEWASKVDGFDVICTWGDYVLDNLEKLENVLVTYPYTELGAFDSAALASRNVYVANAKGGNRKSIAEWAMFMMLSLQRQFPTFLRTTIQHPFTSTESLEGKKIVIIGHGTIGTEVGERCSAFGMEVAYFNRGDDLKSSVADADIVLNALNCNESSKNLLSAEFFQHLKESAYYITFSRPYTYDIDGLINALDEGKLAGAAIDCDPEPLFDISNEFYKKCMTNEKILVTPHVAGVTKQAAANGLEIMVQNIEAYIAGNPQNIVKK